MSRRPSRSNAGYGMDLWREPPVTELDVVKKIVPYIVQGLMECGYEENQDETEEEDKEEDKEMEEAPMSRKEAMIHFNNMEKQAK
eukprot:1362668-Heterocapsa_arctica.AAC.1